MKYLATLLLFCGLTSAQFMVPSSTAPVTAAANAAPTTVQNTKCEGSSNPVSGCAFSVAPTAGNSLAFLTVSSGNPCTSVTGAGDTFNLWKDQRQPGTNPTHVSVWFASSVGTSNSFTVTCPSASNFLGAAMWELHNPGSGTTTPDVVGGAIGSGTSISIPTTFSVGAVNEAVLCAAFQATNYTTYSAGGGYTQDNEFFSNSGFLGASEHKTTVTGLSGVQTCAMTAGSGFFWSGAIATFSNSAAQGSANDLLGFEGLSNTVAPTVATLTASIYGPGGGTSLSGFNQWVVTNTHSSLTGSTSAQLHNLVTSQQIGASSYDGSGSLGLQYATGTGGDSIQWAPPSAVNTASMGYWFKTDIPQNESVSNAYSLGQIVMGAADAVNPQIQASGSALSFKLECRFGPSGGSVSIATNTTYWVTVQAKTNGGACTEGTNCNLHSMAVYDTSGAQVGSTLTCSSKSGNNPITSFQVGISGAESESAGHNIWFDDVIFNYLAGTFPLGP